MLALLCIGETEEEKSAGLSEKVLREQLSRGLELVKASECGMIWVAYEPVWAIGVNGKPITFDYADEMLTKIRGILTELFGEGGESVPVFYGGSVNNENAVPLSHCRDIDGLFIGRSAWDADNFNSLIRMVMADCAARL